MDNTIFNTEAEFEQKVIEALQRKGWGEYEVIKYPTEEQLLKIGQIFFLKTIGQ